MSAALASLVLLAAVAGAQPAELALHADRVVVEGDRVTGQGNVRAFLLGGELTAAGFEVGTDGRGLTVTDGCWRGRAGQACFQRLTVEGDGEIALDGARVTPCACGGDRPLWEVGARHVRVDLERRLVFVGGALRVGGCPVLPLPAGSLPLAARRSGLLGPRIGWTPDGPEVGQPVYLTLGPAADLTLTPTWREQRGFRLAEELRWALPRAGGGHVEGAFGWDPLAQRWRGLAAGEHGYVDRALRTAAEGSLASDSDYLADFSPDYTSRQVGFHEARALVDLGPWRLEHDGFQDPAGAAQRLAALSVHHPAAAGNPLSPHLDLGLELAGWGRSRMDLDRTWLLLAGRGGLAAGRRLGAAEGEVDLSAEGIAAQPLGGVPGRPVDDPRRVGRAVAEGRLALPLWADHGPVRHLLRPGLVAGAAPASGSDSGDWADGWLPDLPAWWVGPVVESRWLSERGVPLHLRFGAPWSADGLRPEAQAWWQRGPWWGRLHGALAWRPGGGPEGGLARAEAGRDGEGLGVAVGLLALQDASDVGQVTARATWALPWSRDRWRPWARARWSPSDGRFVEEEVGLAFSSRCGCLGVEVAAAWAEDLAWPGLRLGFSAGR